MSEYLDAVEADNAIDKPASFDKLVSYISDKPLDYPRVRDGRTRIRAIF